MTFKKLKHKHYHTFSKGTYLYTKIPRKKALYDSPQTDNRCYLQEGRKVEGYSQKGS